MLRLRGSGAPKAKPGAEEAPKEATPSPGLRGLVCGICLDPMGPQTSKTMASGPCGHIYCADCLKEVCRVQRKCPTCRKALTARNVRNVFVS
ncbi:hypothetical protein H632_c5225p0 [Helicosporidium sp. ATCC 50920]|nr:hypothetical protein H632_c5225p0 [Helicosporidium sp. ATCC 50920]|eukprot:KDD71353.1 hypothetical protein H632_c5225p0 [Helicosporidium sp. ATCC 50920]